MTILLILVLILFFVIASIVGVRRSRQNGRGGYSEGGGGTIGYSDGGVTNSGFGADYCDSGSDLGGGGDCGGDGGD